MTEPVYLDCNATTPVDPTVLDTMWPYFSEQIGNAGSRTHDYGLGARRAVETARRVVAEAVAAEPNEVLFTSGATEANNLALLGLADHGLQQGRRHVISSRLEHKAILEPLEQLEARGFEVTYLPAGQDGWVKAADLESALRDDTLLVSLMHVNNETGVIQPIEEFAEVLGSHSAFLHVDAAQSFGKLPTPLRNRRVDLMSVSSHKVYGPKGVGSLIARRRNYSRPPLAPLFFGGGQERGLRPGTLAVPLIVGFGEATQQAMSNLDARRSRCDEIRKRAIERFAALKPRYHGAVDRMISHTLNLGIPGVDGEAAMVAVKDLIAISNGSACTSTSYKSSHVLLAMGYSEREAQEALRISWCHLTPDPPWRAVVERLGALA